MLCHWHMRGRPTSVESVCEGLYITRVRIWGVLAYAPLAPGFFRELRNLLREFAPDVLHVHLPNLSAFWLLLQPGLNNLVLHWHSDVLASNRDWQLRLLYPAYRLPEKWLLRKARAIVPTSQAYMQLSPVLQEFSSKCQVVPLGLSLQEMDEIQDKIQTPGLQARMRKKILGQQAEGIPDFILSVGRLTYYKGYEYLLQACAKGFSGLVIIVGEGSRRARLERLRRQLGLEEQVLLPGSLAQEELHWLLKSCAAFCLPSIERTEAFGLVLLEAMYYAKPLITTAVPGSGMNEVNVQGETGLVVPPAEPGALAEALELMLQDRERAKSMGRKGRERLEAEFNFAAVGSKLEEAYSQLAKPGSMQ